MTAMPPPPAKQHSVAVEDYIKQIWKLLRAGRRATTMALAERLGLGRGTVSGMLKQLASRGLVEHEPYRGVQLTPRGNELALRIVRRHRLIELFLVHTLGLGWDEVDREAERLEHAFSDELVEHIDRYLGHPDTDPHGAPIPSAAGRVEHQNFRPLADLAPGETGRIRRVSDSDPQFLKYLRRLGIKLDVELQVIDIDPFGTLHLRIGSKKTHLAREATQRIHVSG